MGSHGNEATVSRARPSRRSTRPSTPAFSQYILATDVHSSLMSQQISFPPGISPRAMQIAE
jgi:hypothetical protein